MTRPDLAEELLAMASEDLSTRARLTADGSLFEGYHPEMRAVHERNADRLAAVFGEYGWPAPALVGAEASEAAWLVVQHAISRPPLMRLALELLRRPENAGAVPPARLAMLEDRIRIFEGRKQRFGTQFDWDAVGEISPLPIEDPAMVDHYRSEVGLSPLAQAVAGHREGSTPEHQPADLSRHRAEGEAFAREVGWR